MDMLVNLIESKSSPMKQILLILFVFISFHSFSQNLKNISVASATDPTTYISVKTHGYVNGIRLDSIDMKYAQVRYSADGIQFDYGQQWSKRKEMTIMNELGTPIDFDPKTLSKVLNFLHFNGWDLVEGSPVENTFLVKKASATASAN